MKKIKLDFKPNKASKNYKTEYVTCLHLRSNPKHFIDLQKNSFSILYQRDKKIITAYNNKGLSISPKINEVLVCSPNTLKDLELESGISNCFAIIFSQKALDEAVKENILTLKDKNSLHNYFGLIKSSPWLRSLLEQFYYETVVMLSAPPGCTNFLEKQIINEIMRCLFTNYHIKRPEFKETKIQSEIHEIIKYIETHLFDEELLISKIAKVNAISESTLVRKFKAAMNETPQKYIKGRRLDCAYSFLVNDGLSVSEACYMVGYSDLPSFTRSFKSRFGLSPSKISN